MGDGRHQLFMLLICGGAILSAAVYIALGMGVGGYIALSIEALLVALLFVEGARGYLLWVCCCCIPLGMGVAALTLPET